MVIWSDEQVSVAEIALRLHCRPKTVRKWLRRFKRSGAPVRRSISRYSAVAMSGSLFSPVKTRRW
ncbi:MAG: hypothetical protein DMF64_08610 [Acidobacteria bacterium]|nr:MAG: hypothetical protein DMF64_08610 [Acidobacteriota bacterium]